MNVADKTLPQLQMAREVVAYEIWSGRNELGHEACLPRNAWTGELEREIERREWAEKYPEHTKLKAIPEAERDAIGGFIEWLDDRGYAICDLIGPPPFQQGYLPVRMGGIEGWLANYFGIDQQALSEEKNQMYQELVRGG